MIHQSTFQPITGLSHHHLQTLLPTLLHLRGGNTWQGQELELPDGDFVDLVWTSRPDPTTNRPIVVIFHGLEGSVRSPYAQDILQSLDLQGWHGVLMHFRGCSGRPNRLPRSYHSGETGDAGYLLEYLRREYPQAPLAAVGYSLGGNMLLKLQAELGDTSPLRAAVSVCAPIRLDLCADRIRQGFSRVYQSHLVRRMKRNLLSKYPQHDYHALIGLGKKEIMGLDDFWSFDDAYTAPMHGFKNVHDYYDRSSARQYLGAIQKPTLILHARDDPFMPAEVIPDASELSSSVELELSQKGGHVGFIKGSLLNPESWLAERIPEYLDEYLDKDPG
jgi:predicted alpha/beta-fold hydrolase